MQHDRSQECGIQYATGVAPYTGPARVEALPGSQEPPLDCSSDLSVASVFGRGARGLGAARQLMIVGRGHFAQELLGCAAANRRRREKLRRVVRRLEGLMWPRRAKSPGWAGVRESTGGRGQGVRGVDRVMAAAGSRGRGRERQETDVGRSGGAVDACEHPRPVDTTSGYKARRRTTRALSRGGRVG